MITYVKKSTGALLVKNLSVRLPANSERTYAVREVSISIRPGQVHCVIGESGSGKSVCAQAVMGLLPSALRATAGSIEFDGRQILSSSNADLRALRGRDISMIFQEPMTALNPVMPLGRQVEEVLKIHTDLGPKERRTRVLDVMGEVLLPNPSAMYDRYPHEVSGGQRQRVMIAAALALEPRILIADEPTTALDVTTQAEILRLIKKIQLSHGMGVLFITHDFGVVADIADEVSVMCKGDLVETGSVQEVLRDPKHDYTKMLISAVPRGFARPSQDADGRIEGTGVHIASVSKVFEKRRIFGRGHRVVALNDICLDIKGGRTLGVVGESGSGKSTLARCIVRLETPTSGSIALRNTADPNKVGPGRPFQRDVQFIFQDPNRSLNPRRRIGESIIEGPMNFGMDRASAMREAQALLNRVGLERVSLDRYPHEFSGGQRQRISIARALAMKPSVLIADEAVSALDVSVQAQVLELLKEIKDQLKLTLIFITHDLRVAAKICDEIVVMRNGRVVESATARQIFESPRNEYTISLIQAAPGRSWLEAVPQSGELAALMMRQES